MIHLIFFTTYDRILYFLIKIQRKIDIIMFSLLYKCRISVVNFFHCRKNISLCRNRLPENKKQSCIENTSLLFTNYDKESNGSKFNISGGRYGCDKSITQQVGADFNTLEIRCDLVPKKNG